MATQAAASRSKLRTHDQVSPSRTPSSLATIAKRTGICRSHLFRIMDGSRIPSLPVAHKLATALKISLDELYSRLMRVKARRAAKKALPPLTPATTPNQNPTALL